MNNDQLCSLIYESTLKPESYDPLIEAWSDFLERQNGQYSRRPAASHHDTQEMTEIRDHLMRAEAILNEIGRTAEAEPCDIHPARIDLALSESGTVIRSNAVADMRLGGKATLSSLYDACDADSAQRLRCALHGLGQCRVDRFVTLLTLPHEGDASTQYLSVRLRTDLAGRRRVLEIQSLAIPWSLCLEEELEQIFGLTPSEKELCRLLVEGLSLKQIAEIKGRSIETLRVQLKATFRKTYSNGQAELIRTIMMLASVIEASRADAAQAFADDEVYRIKLPDGRQTSVHSYGDERGAPVVFLHGMMDAFGGPIHMQDALKAAGLRLICPVRAGFGDADPIATSGRRAQRTVVADMAYCLDRLGIGRCALLGHLSGGAYAFGLADALGEKVTGMVNVSGAVPIRSYRQFQAMAPRQKVVALTSRYFPKALPPLLRIGLSQIDTSHCDSFVNALFARGTPDRDLIEQCSLYSLLAEQYRWSNRQGYHGFRLDSSIVTIDWSDMPGWKLPQIAWLHGRKDPVVDHGTAQRFARSLNGTRFKSFDEDGQLILYRHPDTVIEQLLQYV